MNRYSQTLALLTSLFSLNVFAYSAVVQCIIGDSKGTFEYRKEIDIKKNFEVELIDRSLPEVKFRISFSYVMNTVCSFIKDEGLNIEAAGVEWFNSTPKGAHSAVRLSTAKGSFLLSCAIVGLDNNPT